jgi:hypothetical protein
MEPLAASMPLMVLPGNHEIEEDNTTLQTFLPYRHRYVMPAALPEKTAPIRPAAWHGRPVAEISYEGGSSFYSFEVRSRASLAALPARRVGAAASERMRLRARC